MVAGEPHVGRASARPFRDGRAEARPTLRHCAGTYVGSSVRLSTFEPYAYTRPSPEITFTLTRPLYTVPSPMDDRKRAYWVYSLALSGIWVTTDVFVSGSKAVTSMTAGRAR